MLNDPWSFPDHTDPASWRPSLYSSGSPGSADLTVFTGDPDADLDYDGLCALAEYGFGTSDLVAGPAPFQVAIQPNGDLTISFGENLYAGYITAVLEVSSNLTSWQAAGPEYVVTESIDHGDGTATTTVTLPGPTTDERLFFRMHFSQAP